MRAIIQLVQEASVEVQKEKISEIKNGYLILLAVHVDDNEEKIKKMADKIAGLRIFADYDDKMNLSLKEAGGEILLVSQFTLYGDTAKGNRPSFITSARPEKAEPYYNQVADSLRDKGFSVKTGKFGAHMLVSLVNNGPTTIIIDL